MAKHKRKKPLIEDDDLDLDLDRDMSPIKLEVFETQAILTPVLYLPENQEPRVVLALVTPDLEQCQCEWPDQTSDTFGPRPRVRCDQSPTVVAFQKRVKEDTNPTGAISLCDDHRMMVDHMHPGQCYYRVITHDKKIGDVV